MVDPFDIGIGRIVRPATPVCFRIKAGEKVIQNLELIPAARVSGVIEIEPLPQTMTGENAVFGHGQETDASILNGTVIELRNDDEMCIRDSSRGRNKRTGTGDRAKSSRRSTSESADHSFVSSNKSNCL